ncbi:hypothetical protein BISA_1650 [Bifidobacterium saguini DSM 23967]|uniref:Zinc ribbon domain-containing protein n=3 Tax=Bifidobacterium TaxID=1678 RepID=A0A2N5ISH1_9BIFI|nr:MULTISPECIES: zinc ribbon domain-containing protein [Bifidobacterium]KFI93828.1 hypothetical protein BISA_1650 [Bifidobacterium saguini DSM 23967]PLS24904.1 hypothetical protein Tam1G_1043 [Bifidobacterium imperatoris]QSY56851.1 zinc ribbon domain-containing protein [Bifidobacterium imperatoris]QTB91568.1 zinc ribbon domain-containing protein [Bifidobacterium saguini]
MFCPSCGKPNAEGAKFCAYCGKPMPQQPAQQAAPQQPTQSASSSQPQPSIPLPNQSGTQSAQAEQKPTSHLLDTLHNAPRGLLVTVVVVAALAVGSLALHGFGSTSKQASSQQQSSSSTSADTQSNGADDSSDGTQQEDSPVSISDVSYSKSYYWDSGLSKQDCYVVSMTVSSSEALTVAPTIRVDYSATDKYGDVRDHVVALGGHVTKYASIEDENSEVGGFQIFANTAGGTSNFSIGASAQRTVDFYIIYDADAVTDVSKISVIDSQYSEDDSSSEGTLDEDALSQIKFEKQQAGDNGHNSLTGTVENTTNDKWPSAKVSVMFTIDGHPVAGGSGFMVSGKVDKPLKPGASGTCTIEQPLTDEEVAKTGGTLAWQVASVSYDIDSE